MKRPARYWLALKSSLWFVPAVLSFGAVAVAISLVQIDMRWQPAKALAAEEPLITTSAEGSRSMLEAIASSMITVAGVVFSITIVTLSLASSQYSPRVLRNFMTDRANQLVLGVFVGIFAYCMVVLGTIRSEEPQFVPSLAVAGGAALALVGIGFLIFFIHHTARSIQASQIISDVATETIKVIEVLYPAGAPPPVEIAPRGVAPGTTWTTIPAAKSGYIQDVDLDELVEIAIRADVVLRAERRVGEFAVERLPLGSVSGPHVDIDELSRRVNKAFSIDHLRTVEQDPSWGIRQIVDVALKGLSPGINDPTTAITCIDYLSAILVRLADRGAPVESVVRDGKVRLILQGIHLREFVSTAFDEIRENARGQRSVLRQLLRALERLAEAGAERVGGGIGEQLDATIEAIERTVAAPRERALLLEQAGGVRRSLSGHGPERR